MGNVGLEGAGRGGGCEPPPLPIHVVQPATRLLSAKVRAFVELIAATCDWRFVEL